MLLRAYLRVERINCTKDTRALALTNSIESHQMKRETKRTQAWGFKSTTKKAPSRCRPSTRVKWVGGVLY